MCIPFIFHVLAPTEEIVHRLELNHSLNELYSRRGRHFCGEQGSENKLEKNYCLIVVILYPNE